MQLREHVPRQLIEVPDGVLAQCMLTGDQSACEILVQRESGSLFPFICRFFNDYDAASDMLQQILPQ